MSDEPAEAAGVDDLITEVFPDLDPAVVARVLGLHLDPKHPHPERRNR